MGSQRWQKAIAPNGIGTPPQWMNCPGDETLGQNDQYVYIWMTGNAGIILCMHTANERWRYNVRSSLIGWAHTQNDPWECTCQVPVLYMQSGQ